MSPLSHLQLLHGTSQAASSPCPPRALVFTSTGLQAYSPLDRAVISSCLHAFCITCLAAWCERKRACPVCRGSVASYFHTIASDTDFLEHVFPPEKGAEPAGTAAAAAHHHQQTRRLGLFDVDALLDLRQEADRLTAAVDSLTAQLRNQHGGGGGSAAVVDRDGSSGVQASGRARQPQLQLVQERFSSW